MLRDRENSLRFTISRESSSPDRLAKNFVGSGCIFTSGRSCGFENQDLLVVQLDFGGCPCRTCFFATYFTKATKVRKASKHKLVDAVRVGIWRIPRAVEPVEVGFVVRNAIAAGGGES